MLSIKNSNLTILTEKCDPTDVVIVLYLMSSINYKTPIRNGAFPTIPLLLFLSLQVYEIFMKHSIVFHVLFFYRHFPRNVDILNTEVFFFTLYHKHTVLCHPLEVCYK